MGADLHHMALAQQAAADWDALVPQLEALVKSGRFVGGTEIDLLEEEISPLVGGRPVVALNSGTDALELCLQLADIGKGDEVILPCNSFIASAGAVIRCGATPVFVDVRADRNIDPAAVEAAITAKTRAIMPVHLGGLPCDMAALQRLADRFDLLLLEDAAQSIGSRWRGVPTGALGDMAAFSMHPLKNLGAMGDAGFAVLPHQDLANRMRRLRSHGLEGRNDAAEWGRVSRLDAIQALVLRHRLPKLQEIITARQGNVARYHDLLAGLEELVLPQIPDDVVHSCHTFIIEADNLDALQAFLKDKGVQTAVHYPVPLHLLTAAQALGYKAGDMPVAEAQAARILTLPIHQFLQAADIDYIAGMIRDFYHG